MRSLRKRDVEALIAGYDSDPTGALASAMRVVLEMHDEVFPTLVRAAGFSAHREQRLLAHDIDALDELARELNELRTLTSSADHG